MESTIIHQGFANLFKGMEGVGGKLYLTKEQLHHKPHKINLQSDEVFIAIEDIEKIEFFSNRIFGITVSKNGLSVQTKQGKEFRFVVNKRQKWKDAIEKVMTEE